MAIGFEKTLEKFLHLGYYEYAADSEVIRGLGKITKDLSTTPPNKDIFSLIKGSLCDEIKHFDYEFSRDTPIHKKLSRLLQCNTKDITLVAGAEEGLRVISQVLLESNSSVLISQPNFSRVNFYPSVFGVQDVSEMFSLTTPKNEYCDLLNKKLTENQYDVCYLCNPNNPTGMYIPIEEILQVIDMHQQTFFVIDMALYNYILEKISLEEILQRRNVGLIFSFSKVFGVPGIRVGFIVTSNRELNLALRNIISPFHLSSVSMNIVTVLLTKIKTVRKYLRKERKLILHNHKVLLKSITNNKHLSLLGEPSYNITLVGNKGNSKDTLFKYLLSKGVLTVDLSNLQGMQGMNAVRVVLTKERLDFLADLLNNY